MRRRSSIVSLIATMTLSCCLLAVTVTTTNAATSEAPPQASTSKETRACLLCHERVTPAIVADWRQSRMSRVSPAMAMAQPRLRRRFSATTVDKALLEHAVGCAECHGLSSETHEDSFSHMGYEVHIVVSPKDCAHCHPTEADQYGQNVMSHAHGNLVDNELYRDLQRNVSGTLTTEGVNFERTAPHPLTAADSCLTCHGTKVTVTGSHTVDSSFGPMKVPTLSGWPNQGAGRINPDGSKGSCSACHPRHSFAIEVARKPHTCSQCHSGPDVPAAKIYDVSKHGNVYRSHHGQWDFTAVPWTPGTHFRAPTCATCHMSLLTTASGSVIVERSHKLSDRLPWRLFGVPYAHAHPKSPDHTVIRNDDGQPLPTTLTGKPASQYLIDEKEQEKRWQQLTTTCKNCHGSSWIAGHRQRLEHVIDETNEATKVATALLQQAWQQGLAAGPPGSLFDDALEIDWVESWLFYANSIRLSSAMAGADYGVFAGGRWQLNRRLKQLRERLAPKR